MAGSRRLCATDSSAGSNHRGRNRGETLNTHACARLELAGQNIATRAGSVSAHTQMPASDRGSATPPSRFLRPKVRHRVAGSGLICEKLVRAAELPLQN